MAPIGVGRHDDDMHHDLQQPTTPAPVETTARGPVMVVLRAGGIGLVAGLATGFGLGWLAIESAMNSCPPSDGWCSLGANLAGLFLGVVAGGVAYVTAGVVVILRERPKGHRAALIVAHLALPATLWMLATLLTGLAVAIG